MRPARIQLFRHKKNSKQAYWSAGIMTLSEEVCRLDQPHHLINACAKEFDAASTPKKYKSHQLDILTTHVQQKVVEGHNLVTDYVKRQRSRPF